MVLGEFIAVWLVMGLIIQAVQAWVDDAEMPWQHKSFGIMLIWPLYVAKWSADLVLWMIKNLRLSAGSSLGSAFKTLVGKD